MGDPKKAEGRAREEAMSADFLDRFAARAGLPVQAKAVFGDPVERKGVTVIPVARARWGFGGGSGTSEDGRGSGGGGGAIVSPLGFIEISGGSAEFRRIRDPRLGIALAAALLVLGPRLLRSIPRR